jgi:hypothetical protein
MEQLHATRRAAFGHIAEHNVTRLTNRELSWLAHINRHGPQPSTALYDLTATTHRCRDTSLRSLQRLRAGGILGLPPQQRAIAHADFHPYIYDITPLGRAYLENADRLEAAIRPTGHWWHSYGVGALTSTIDRMGAKNGITYIPAHQILAQVDRLVTLPTAHGPVIPDQLFALNYGGGFRAFLLEHDRGTEPLVSKAARESLQRKLVRYEALVASDGIRRHYGLTCPVALLFTFTSKLRAKHFAALVTGKFPTLAPTILSTILDPNDPLLLHARNYITAPWQRVTDGTFDILAT